MTESEFRPTILVTEDDPSMLEIITFLLEDEGYRVLQAANAEIALSILQQNTPSLIISDIMMPGMDGFEFYERVRANAQWAQLPFIFLTARGQRVDIRRGMGLGADDYITKPFEPEDLLEAVKIRLTRAAEAQAAFHKISVDLQEKIIQSLTHEFRTPLALVVGYTELLESTGQQMEAKDFRTVLNGLLSGSKRLTHLVEDFLLLSRLNMGDIALEARQEARQTTSPEWVVDQLVAQFESLPAAENISFTTDHQAPGLTLAIGQPELTEIVRRLIDNTVKFSKEAGGHVTVTTCRDGGDWVLKIADDGIGIHEDALPWIFEAFRQVDRDKYEQQGSGVGLTIVRGLAEAYGGRVAVQSTSGVGSTFTVWVPLASER
jgi:two-component system sensor histidine kinase/response regulator